MSKRLPQALSVFDLRPEWRRTRRFIPTGFRMVNRAQRDADHWQGGPPIHRSATCSQCSHRLTLIYDLSLADPKLPDFVRESFCPATRLPLYFCGACATSDYWISSDAKLVALPPISNEESPFEDFPTEFPRRRVALSQVPSTIDGLLTLEDTVGFVRLDRPAIQALSAYYRRPIRSGGELPFSQFGGQPLVCQGHRQIVCPNPKCPAHQLQHPFGELEYDFLMKELAVVCRDASPYFDAAYAQIVYHICCTCLAIHAEYRCT